MAAARARCGDVAAAACGSRTRWTREAEAVLDGSRGDDDDVGEDGRGLVRGLYVCLYKFLCFYS